MPWRRHQIPVVKSHHAETEIVSMHVAACILRQIFEVQEFDFDAGAVHVVSMRNSQIRGKVFSIFLQHGKDADSFDGISGFFGLEQFVA